MNIYLCDGLEYIESSLRNKGYNVVKDNSIHYDAIICDLKNCDINSMNQIKSIKSEGTLIIDYGYKTIEDIDYILNNRLDNSLL